MSPDRGTTKSMLADKTIAPVQTQLNLVPSQSSIGFTKYAHTPDGKFIMNEEKKHSRPQSGTALLPRRESESDGTPKIAPVDFEKKPLPGDSASGLMFSTPDENNPLPNRNNRFSSSIAETGQGLNSYPIPIHPSSSMNSGRPIKPNLI
jgi:hypothetical protein